MVNYIAMHYTELLCFDLSFGKAIKNTMAFQKCTLSLNEGNFSD